MIQFKITLKELIKRMLIISGNEARHLITSGAVSVNNIKHINPLELLRCCDGSLMKIGKRKLFRLIWKVNQKGSGDVC